MLNENELENDLNQIDSVKQETSDDNTNDNDLLDDDLLNEGEGVVSLKELRKQKGKKSNLTMFLSIIAFIVFVLFVLVFGINYFLQLSLSDKKIEGFDKDYVDFVGKNILSSDSTLVLDNMDIKDPMKRSKNIEKYLKNQSVIFYDKQVSLKKFKQDFINYVNKDIKDLNNIKNNLIKYRYLPKELNSIIKDIKLTPILLTLNSIKLYVTDYVFIKTGKFNSLILSKVKDSLNYNYLRKKVSKEIKISGITKKVHLVTLLKNDIERLRELGAKTYLNNIVFNYMYINPKLATDQLSFNYFINKFYEDHKFILDNTCGLENEKCKNFSGISLSEFKSSYIPLLVSIYEETNNLFSSNELEQLPVDIVLLNYDPEKQVLSFNIKLYIKEGSKVSVIGLTTDIITLLRESRLIIGKNIGFDKLKVNKVVMRNTGEKQVYDTISLIFKTSVQSKVNVEVTDSKK